MLWTYFDFPLKYYNIQFSNITYHSNGVVALKSKSKIIGAKSHWYSTEDILKCGRYNGLIIEKGLIKEINNNLADNIRRINRRICEEYLNPTVIYTNKVRYNFWKRFNIPINKKYYSVHLRVGDVDNQPFQKYINKSDILYLIKHLQKLTCNRIVILSDSAYIKRKIKEIIGSNIYTDYSLPCHSRYIKCINQSMDDILMMKYSDFLILTRGSTFSLFGLYFSKCSFNNIMFIGHDYEHSNYYN